MLTEILIISLRVLNVLFIISMILPLMRKDHWTFRVFEFPRLQKLFIALVLLSFNSFLIAYFNNWIEIISAALLIISIVYLLYQIMPFTTLSNTQIKDAKEVVDSDTLSILINNVYQFNSQYKKLINLIQQKDPDLILLLETDQKWKNACLEGFGENYPYQILEDLDNTYGMLLFSKRKLENIEIRELIKEGIPSVKLSVILNNGEKITFYGIHPEPPVPSQNPYATARDAEILMVAKEVKDFNSPVIVAGDLNDVAWSYTTELFLKESKLLDPRRGRGFFNTFHAKHKLLRWPLDHLFCSEHFHVVEIERLSSTGSDHFPMYIKLQLCVPDGEEEKMKASTEEEEIVNEKIEKSD